MPNKYSVELTENERMFLIIACGAAIGTTVVCEPSEPPANALTLARRLVDARSNVISPAPAAPAQPIPAAPTAPTMPEGATEAKVHIFAVRKKGSGKSERLVVQWEGEGSKMVFASCWADHKDAWPRVMEKVKQTVTLYIVRKGEYLNIVGVK